MPNWCSNTLVLQHSDPAMIVRAAEAAKADKLCAEFVPLGGDGPEGWDYTLAVENWGTKWDISQTEVIDQFENSISLAFESAWSPPIAFYDRMVEMGFEVHATYFEPGMGYVGKYIDGEDEEYEIDPEDLSNIPEELNEVWGVTEMYEDWDAD